VLVIGVLSTFEKTRLCLGGLTRTSHLGMRRADSDSKFGCHQTRKHGSHLQDMCPTFDLTTRGVYLEFPESIFWRGVIHVLLSDDISSLVQCGFDWHIVLAGQASSSTSSHHVTLLVHHRAPLLAEYRISLKSYLRTQSIYCTISHRVSQSDFWLWLGVGVWVGLF